jgi:hypothetical protein
MVDRKKVRCYRLTLYEGTRTSPAKDKPGLCIASFDLLQANNNSVTSMLLFPRLHLIRYGVNLQQSRKVSVASCVPLPF